ncbi:ankyrin repeat domain-containing protein [Pontiellaceae bacterium B1224]|nr:ankyrin repeat domain-containing protein [Pontiellaceae bacterium B1224]
MAELHIVRERLKSTLTFVGIGVFLGALASWYFHGQIEFESDRNRFVLAAIITGSLTIGWIGLLICFIFAGWYINPANRFTDRVGRFPWGGVAVVVLLGGIGTASVYVYRYSDQARSEFDLLRTGHFQSLEERIDLQPLVLEKKNADGQTLLQCAYRDDNLQGVSLLIKKGAEVVGLDPLGLDPVIASLENPPMLGALLDSGLNPDIADEDGVPAIHYAVLQESSEPMLVLLNAGAKVDARDRLSRTPLMRAVENDALPMVGILVEQGASMNAFDQRGDTALHLAARRWNPEMIRVLLQHDADPRIFNFAHLTPVHIAAQAGQTDLVRIFLEQPGMTELCDDADRTPLDLALLARKYETATLLIESGANVDRPFLDGSTLLQNIILAKDYSTAGFLIRAGASTEIPDKSGRTALSIIHEKQLSGLAELIHNRTNAISVSP